MDTYCASCRMNTAGQHESSCSLYEGVIIVRHTGPTLWLEPCDGCKEKDATIAALREALKSCVESLEYISREWGGDGEFKPWSHPAVSLRQARALLTPAPRPVEPPTEPVPGRNPCGFESSDHFPCCSDWPHA